MNAISVKEKVFIWLFRFYAIINVVVSLFIIYGISNNNLTNKSWFDLQLYLFLLLFAFMLFLSAIIWFIKSKSTNHYVILLCISHVPFINAYFIDSITRNTIGSLNFFSMLFLLLSYFILLLITLILKKFITNVQTRESVSVKMPLNSQMMRLLPFSIFIIILSATQIVPLFMTISKPIGKKYINFFSSSGYLKNNKPENVREHKSNIYWIPGPVYTTGKNQWITINYKYNHKVNGFYIHGGLYNTKNKTLYKKFNRVKKLKVTFHRYGKCYSEFFNLKDIDAIQKFKFKDGYAHKVTFKILDIYEGYNSKLALSFIQLFNDKKLEKILNETYPLKQFEIY